MAVPCILIQYDEGIGLATPQGQEYGTCSAEFALGQIGATGWRWAAHGVLLDGVALPPFSTSLN